LDLFQKQLLDCQDAAYAAARGVGDWESLLGQLVAALPGTKAAIESKRSVAEGASGLIASGYDPAIIEKYASYYSRINPWAPYVERMALFAPETSDAVFPSSLFRHHEFYTGFIEPAGDAESATFVKLFHGSECHVFISLHYGTSIAETYNRIVPEFLAKLSPHLRNAVAISIDLNAARRPTSVITGLVHQFQAAAFLLDGSGKVLEANERADELLAQGTVVALVEGGQLRIANTVAEARLKRALATDEAAAGPRAAAAPSAWRFLEFPYRVSDPRLGWLPADAKWVIALFGSSHVSTLAAVKTEEFGLTRQETRVAMSLVDGLTVKEIAETFGISNDTVRKHLKSIFRKTKTHRQVELLARLVASPMQASDGVP
jgi:DNA-binding CsgD family transcriptional regulator